MRYTQKHIDKMIAIIRKQGVLVIKKNEFWNISRSHSHVLLEKQSITIGMKGSKWQVLPVICHEWGHTKSFLDGTAHSIKDGLLYYSLGVISDKRHAKAIIDEERRAWRLGFELLRDNGIEVDESLLWLRDQLVAGHVRRVKKLLRRMS